MKGLILAGGYGTRIRPCSYYLNKHMWPVYNRPLIEYAIERLIWADITQIGIVLGGSHPNQVKSYLGDGARYGVSFTYIWQGAPRGISNAVNCAKNFCGEDKFIVHLADNLITADLGPSINKFQDGHYGCLIMLKKIKDPRRFGVAEFKEGSLVGLEEKPTKPKSNLALVGVYGFNSKFFEFFKNLKPSWRGEYELTDIINAYIKAGEQIYVKKLPGAWFSCDTFDILADATLCMQEKLKMREKRL